MNEPTPAIRTTPADPRPMAAFGHVEAWIFDLDNTLYPSRCNLFAQVDRRMTSFIADYLGVAEDEARRIQKDYYRDHGTTLNGLMRLHGLDPGAFLDFVHDIDLSVLEPAPALQEAIGALPGRRLVHTNGSRGHARRVMERLGIADAFDDIFAIECLDYMPKPETAAYERLIAATGITPGRAAMFEDIARNLEAPHMLGMTTVWVRPEIDWSDARGHSPGKPDEPPGAAHVHHVTDDLATFLAGIARSH
jgi:putative hydrolase of the HAD superfamily